MKRENLELARETIETIENLEYDLRALELLEETGGQLEVVVHYDGETTGNYFEDYTRFYTRISIKKEKIIADFKAIKKAYEDTLETL